MAIRTKKPVPFTFVLDALEAANPITRPMFGCTAVYIGDKIVLVLRDKGPKDPDTGVWIITMPEHHSTLLGDFPSLRSIQMFDKKGPAGWRKLAASDPDFEESALRLCSLILKGDSRLGNVPKAKKRPKARAQR